MSSFLLNLDQLSPAPGHNSWTNGLFVDTFPLQHQSLQHHDQPRTQVRRKFNCHYSVDFTLPILHCNTNLRICSDTQLQEVQETVLSPWEDCGQPIKRKENRANVQKVGQGDDCDLAIYIHTSVCGVLDDTKLSVRYCNTQIITLHVLISITLNVKPSNKKLKPPIQASYTNIPVSNNQKYTKK